MVATLRLHLPTHHATGIVSNRIQLWHDRNVISNGDMGVSQASQNVVSPSATARLHALAVANGLLMTSPPAAPQPRKMIENHVTPSAKAVRVAEVGLAKAEALEANGELSDRSVATMKAEALAAAAREYRKAIVEAAASEEKTARGLINYWELRMEQLRSLAIERGIKTEDASWRECVGGNGNRANIIAALKRADANVEQGSSTGVEQGFSTGVEALPVMSSPPAKAVVRKASPAQRASRSPFRSTRRRPHSRGRPLRAGDTPLRLALTGVNALTSMQATIQSWNARQQQTAAAPSTDGNVDEPLLQSTGASTVSKVRAKQELAHAQAAKCESKATVKSTVKDKSEGSRAKENHGQGSESSQSSSKRIGAKRGGLSVRKTGVAAGHATPTGRGVRGASPLLPAAGSPDDSPSKLTRSAIQALEVAMESNDLDLLNAALLEHSEAAEGTDACHVARLMQDRLSAERAVESEALAHGATGEASAQESWRGGEKAPSSSLLEHDGSRRVMETPIRVGLLSQADQWLFGSPPTDEINRLACSPPTNEAAGQPAGGARAQLEVAASLAFLQCGETARTDVSTAEPSLSSPCSEPPEESSLVSSIANAGSRMKGMATHTLRCGRRLIAKSKPFWRRRLTKMAKDMAAK